jgi:ABC-type sugar transport system ATPase subunit
VLELASLGKRFGSTVALSGLDLRADTGEIVGIAGPNGAGKSTLIHVLAGEVEEDQGTVTLDGQHIPYADRPRHVSVVHQELRLFPTLTVLENLLIGSDSNRFLRPKASAAIRDVAEEFGLTAVADRPIDSCSIVVQQLTEIARAIVHRKRVVLLDEPNSALTAAESDRLFREVLRLKEQGRTIVLLVSHRLADLERYCDRVLVIREGMVAKQLKGRAMTSATIAQAIVGSVLEDVEKAGAKAAVHGSSTAAPGIAQFGGRPDAPMPTGAAPAANSIEVRDWSDDRGGAFAKVDLTVRPGEAVFITGQEDGGGRELIRSIAGLRGSTGTAVALPTIGTGSASYLPGSRASSLFPNLSVRANLCVRLRPDVIARRGLLRMDVMTSTASEWVDKLEIKTSSLAAPIGSLSGGTQQKVAIGSAFARKPTLLILEDPTRGVDIKTREQIVASLRAFVAAGNSILAFSPELDEVQELADTVRVAVHGSLSAPRAIDRAQPLESLAEWVDLMNQERSAVAPT